MARCLLFEKNMPKTLWAEAVNTVVYIQNRLPTKALDHKTPFEVWFGFKPSLAHLKVFGCICYAQVPAIKRGKLDNKAQVGILVGYITVKKGYRILDPSTNKVLTDADQNGPEINFDDEPVRGTIPLANIYERAQVAIVEPSSFEEAEADEGWKQAMIDEIKMIQKNQTWELTKGPAIERPLNADGSLNKLKARLVVKGFSQQYGLDYKETFVPVVRLDTIKLIIALAAQKQWIIYQLDVKSVFLNGFLEEEIYVEQPEEFKVPGEEHKVYKLKKALYGLKQAPRAWYAIIDNYLISLGFERSISEPTLYVKREQAETQLIVSLYIDDLLVTGGDHIMLVDFKAKMKDMFEMSDLGQMTYFLGMKVLQTKNGIFLGQKTFAAKILSKFSMENCKPTSLPMAVGMKLSSQGDYEQYAIEIHALLQHTVFSSSKKSAQSSKKQSIVAQSTAEAEYVATASIVNQAIWLRKILADLNLHQREAKEIYCNNMSAVAIAKNPVFHEEQVADIFTKALGVSRFIKLRKQLGVSRMETKEEC
ncbi:hypothetical protein CXB51_004055 [Gossypium anomalum]|uniref:Reverse transcriptase Ty1/copia-type domain-containing protein n=1 Tax=Gossypium anomalum TaxID=47600 RepID=A0A8J5ZLY8_9ROSI|nr:hypothetical protein CXB51_004055 [Gossypium anomalum]